MNTVPALLLALALAPAGWAAAGADTAERPPVPAEVTKVLEAKEPQFRSGAPLNPKVVSVIRLGPADEKALVEGLSIPASALAAPGGHSEAVIGRATNGAFLSLIRADSRRRADAVISRSPGRRAAGSADLAEARALYYDRGWAFDAPRREALGRIVSAGVPEGKPAWTARVFSVMEAPAARLGGPAGAPPRAAFRPAAQEEPVRGRWEGDRYRTDNFSVGAGPDRDYAQRLAEEAERHRRRMATEWLGAAAPPSGRPITLDYKLYGPGSRGGGGNTTYTVGAGGITGTKMSIQGDRESLLKNILPHEVLHTVLASRLGAGIPRWADEGAASTAESVEEQRKKYLGPLSDSVARSRQFRLSDMMTMTQYPSDPNRIWEFYGQSNSVAHYLIEKGGGGAKGKQILVNFLAEGMKTERWPDALGKYYGVPSAAGLDAEWTRWHAGGGSARAIDRSGLPAPDTQLPVTPLPEPPAPSVPSAPPGRPAWPPARPAADASPSPAPERRAAPSAGLELGASAPGGGATCSAGGCGGASAGGPSRSAGSPASSLSGRAAPAAGPAPSPAPAPGPTLPGPARPAAPAERAVSAPAPSVGPRGPERAVSAPPGAPAAPPRAAPAQPPSGPTRPPSFNARRGAVTMTATLGGGGNAGGSGTVIASIPTNGRYRNVIITAGHTFDGYAGGPIMVTVMIDGKPVVVKARMVKYSYERRDMKEFELAVLEFETDSALEAVKVAGQDAAPGDEVYVVGKAWNEKEITVHATRMGKPNTIGDGTFSRRQSTTEFIPVSGHSGGGLLNAAGELVGVVSGGNGRQGVHTPLEGVRKWLDGLGLGSSGQD